MKKPVLKALHWEEPALDLILGLDLEVLPWEVLVLKALETAVLASEATGAQNTEARASEVSVQAKPVTWVQALVPKALVMVASEVLGGKKEHLSHQQSFLS